MHRPIVALFGLVATLGATPTRAEVALLHNCDTDEGAKPTWGTQVGERSLEVAADKQFVSEGAGSLHLSGTIAPDPKGNVYLGVMLPIPETDLRAKTILVDAWTSTPALTKAFYLRLYNAAGETVGSWNNWGSPFAAGPKQTFKLHRLVSTAGFGFEGGVVEDRVPSAVTKVEFIVGTNVKEGTFDVYVDNLRYDTEPLRSVDTLTEPKKLYLDTVLVENGKPNAVIVHPSGAQHEAIAKSLAEAIRGASGVALPLVTEAPSDTNLILLGNLNNNAAIEPLYGHAYCSADALYPGKGGYVIRTIHDPWGTGKNAILLGGSDAAGVRKAADEFTKALKTEQRLVVPRTFKLVPGEELNQQRGWLTTPPREDHVETRVAAAKNALAAGAHTGLFGMIAGEGERYLWTGFEPYAEAFVKLVVMAHEHYLTKPGTYGGPWGMDSDFMTYRVLPGWDVVEESPVVTDEQRLQVTKILAQWVAEAVAPKARGGRAERVRHNHWTFPALGCYFAGAYFEKYYAVVEGPAWSQAARDCFEIQAKAAKPHEDCNGYQWLTLGHTLHYTCSSGDFTYCQNENARRDADYCIVCMDNFGYQVPYGDTGSYKCWTSEVPFLQRATWYYDSHGDDDAKQWAAGYRWALEKKSEVMGTTDLNRYARDVPAVPPNRLLGVTAWPLDAMYYNSHAHPEGTPPLEKCVDKVVMRDSFDIDREYLLLDGLSNGGHKHYDGNTISRLTDRGRIWLADNDYYKSQPKFHNGVLIFKDGQSQAIPPFCELEYAGDLPSVGFARTVVRDYAGVDWHRSILWEKGKYFVVSDELVAKEPSDYSFRAKWHGVGEPTLRGDGLELEQEGARFYVKHGADMRLTLADDEDLGKNWSGYPYAKPVVRVLTQIADAKLAEGQSTVLPTVLYASDEARPATVAVQSLPNRALSVTDGEATCLVDARLFNAGDPEDGLLVEGQAYTLSQQRLVAFGATSLALGGQEVVHTTKPVDVQLSLVDLSGTLHAAEDATVTWNWGAGAKVLLDGQPVIDPQEFALAAGEHEIRLENASPGYLLGALKLALSQAKPPRTLPAPALAARDDKPLEELWSFRETFSEYLLTNNDGYFESVDVGAKIEVSPEPREENWFGGGSNEAGNLTDGVFLQTDGGVQWDDDQVVTVSIDLGKPYDLTRVRLKQWWADASSKGKTFQLDRAKLLLSNDDTWNDGREAGEIVDREEHGNWGAPGYGPIPYDFSDLGQQARFVRLELTPKKGTAIYLSEIEVWGQGDELKVSAEEARKRGLPVHTFPALFAADVDGDGADEVIAGSTNGSVSLIDSGERKWKFETEQPVHAVTAADLDANGKVEIIAGGADQTVHCLAANGKELWQAKLPRYKSTPAIHVLFTAKLGMGDVRAVIAGADSWRYYAFDHTGKELWHCESVHRSTAGTTVDLERDGIDEVFCGTEYYWWPCVRADGTNAWSYSTRTGPKANSATSGDIDGDGKEEVVVGGADANLHALDHDGKLLWQYNTGDEVTSVHCVDLDGDGTDEIVAGSMSFNVYALKGDGTRLWRRGVGDEVTSVAPTGVAGSPLALGTSSGQVATLSAAGEVLSTADLGAPVLSLIETRARDDARDIVASVGDGTLRAFVLPTR